MSKLTYIAELCQNHLGKEKYVDKMLERCAISGADIVKLQFIYSRNLSFRSQFENGLSNGKKILDIRRPYQADMGNSRRGTGKSSCEIMPSNCLFDRQCLSNRLY